jgi:hypothetical protein
MKKGMSPLMFEQRRGIEGMILIAFDKRFPPARVVIHDRKALVMYGNVPFSLNLFRNIFGSGV